MSRKFYTVFEGRQIGVYDNWDLAREQVENLPGARYKGYRSQTEAVEAFRRHLAGNTASLGDILISASGRPQAEEQPHAVASSTAAPQSGQPAGEYPPEVDLDAWAVDASCLGNPGVMEYRGVELRSGRELFRVGPFEDATNNIGEFLAIVHALALMHHSGDWHTIYSDSRTGMAWVRNRNVRTVLQRTPKNEKVFELIGRALNWLHTHQYRTPILKWQTDRWGEIPADFGRK